MDVEVRIPRENVTFTSRLDRESDRVRQSGIVPTRESHPHYLLDVDNRLVLPVDTKVFRHHLRRRDPRLVGAGAGWKQDAIPGFINEAWTRIEQPGVYRGQCAELCGKDHGFMPIVVEAVSKEDFRKWLAQRAGAARRARHACGTCRTGCTGGRGTGCACCCRSGQRACQRGQRSVMESPRPLAAVVTTDSERCFAMAHSAVGHDDHHHHQSFFERWFFSTNHKDIGTLYLGFSFIMFIIGAAMSVVIRAELAQPGLQFVKPEFFNQMTTVHALVMIFGGVMPAFVGLANWMIPLQIGAPDMALPRMNNWSFWLLPVAFSLLLLTLFLPGGAPAGGWTLYPPLSLQGGYNVAFSVFAIHVAGISSIMGAINIIATVLNMRAPGIDLLKMPIFCWAWLITAFLLIAVMPVLAGAVTMLLTDKFFGTSFFNAAGGGDPVMYQHIFWFFGTPRSTS